MSRNAAVMNFEVVERIVEAAFEWNARSTSPSERRVLAQRRKLSSMRVTQTRYQFARERLSLRVPSTGVRELTAIELCP